MTQIMANCPLCIHIDSSVKYPDTCKCKAFPEGIPDDYLWEENGVKVKEIKECNNGFGFKEYNLKG